MKRIIKETLRSGKEKYVVESNRIFRYIPYKWHVIDYPINSWGDKIPARFDTLGEAEQVLKYGKFNWKTDIIKREIIKKL